MLILTDNYYQYKELIIDMMDEWSQLEKIIPYSIRRLDYKDYDNYVLGFAEENAGIPGLVPASTYFLYDSEVNKIIGAVNIRHFLNEHLLTSGGHIGDGIRPSERKRGYATKMIALALEKCKELRIDRVLMVCDKNNIGSAKSIINNRGILENEVIGDKGETLQRYWIENN